VSAKIESAAVANEEMLSVVEENCENIAANANHLTHAECRVDDLEERVAFLKQLHSLVPQCMKC